MILDRPRKALLVVVAASAGVLSSCNDDEGATADVPACDAEPELLTAADGVEFVRTPDACFQNLPEWPYQPRYVEIDGLRQAYVDEGPVDGEVVLLLHGQPSWSYLYRKMIPVLVDGGYRAIADEPPLRPGAAPAGPDHLILPLAGRCPPLKRL